jgi:hypothetical protein
LDRMPFTIDSKKPWSDQWITKNTSSLGKHIISDHGLKIPIWKQIQSWYFWKHGFAAISLGK